MTTPQYRVRRLAIALCAAAMFLPAWADDAAIRKNIAERLPSFPAIDEISKTGIPGLYELRVGTDLYYADELGNYLIEGQLIDTKTRTNLTEARVAKLSAIDFATLPLKDAIVWKQGSGARKIAVFADPNCGYCKKFERDIQQAKDVTVYTFLYPILGPDSIDKSRNIWCAEDNSKAWLDWMRGGTATPRATGECDTAALQRNMAFGRKHKVNGTPALVFEDGRRVPGAMSLEQIEKTFASLRLPGKPAAEYTPDQAVAAAAPTPAADAPTYTVQKGDSLTKISEKLFGTPNQYRRIFEANKPALSDPGKLRPGQVLRVPPAG